ncbi:MAG: hypothetical protein KatS3mg115_0779 [Candidatus Poribacteria bacterium]|nr:MAG: hypothetical protein KatS3mg115_0779 [Candidatus Poribacteria bacterium]
MRERWTIGILLAVVLVLGCGEDSEETETDFDGVNEGGESH